MIILLLWMTGHQTAGAGMIGTVESIISLSLCNGCGSRIREPRDVNAAIKAIKEYIRALSSPCLPAN